MAVAVAGTVRASEISLNSEFPYATAAAFRKICVPVPVITSIGRHTQSEVGINSVSAGVLQLVCLQLVHQPERSCLRPRIGRSWRVAAKSRFSDTRTSMTWSPWPNWPIARYT
jgi:hypothetical protein